MSSSTTVGWSFWLNRIKHTFPQAPQLNSQQFSIELTEQKETKKNNLIILDVRGAEEYKVSHFFESIHINEKTLISDICHQINTPLNTLIDKKIVCVCSIGWRSSELATRLIEAGCKDVWNLEGGIFTWANEGRNGLMTSKNEPTTLVHPFNTAFGVLLDKQYRFSSSNDLTSASNSSRCVIT